MILLWFIGLVIAGVGASVLVDTIFGYFCCKQKFWNEAKPACPTPHEPANTIRLIIQAIVLLPLLLVLAVPMLVIALITKIKS